MNPLHTVGKWALWAFGASLLVGGVMAQVQRLQLQRGDTVRAVIVHPNTGEVLSESNVIQLR